MRVLLQRNLFAEGNRYRVHSAGTEIPDTVEPLPPGAKVWDGEEFVKAPQGAKEREALAKKGAKAVEDEEERQKKEAKDRIEKDWANAPMRVYDPRYKSPNSPEPIQGTMPQTGEERKEEVEREKRERRQEMDRIEKEKKEGVPPEAEGERWQGKSKSVEYPAPENKTKK